MLIPIMVEVYPVCVHVRSTSLFAGEEMPFLLLCVVLTRATSSSSIIFNLAPSKGTVLPDTLAHLWFHAHQHNITKVTADNPI